MVYKSDLWINYMGPSQVFCVNNTSLCVQINCNYAPFTANSGFADLLYSVSIVASAMAWEIFSKKIILI